MSTKPYVAAVFEQDLANFLATTIRTFSPEVSPVLNELYGSVTQEGEAGPDAALEMERKARVLEGASHELTEAARSRRNAVAERKRVLLEVDWELETVNAELQSVKKRIRARYPEDVVDFLGLAGSFSRRPSELLFQADHLVTKLETPDFNPPTKEGKKPLVLRNEARDLKLAADDLRTAVDAHVAAKKEAENALTKKSDALAALITANRFVGRSLVGEFRFAGFDELADQVFPRLRRRRRQADAGDDPDGGDPNGGDPNSGDPNGGDPNSGDPNGGDPNSGDPTGSGMSLSSSNEALLLEMDND